jgi:hypothetical protein
MQQESLFSELNESLSNRFSIGTGLFLEIMGTDNSQYQLLNKGRIVKSIDATDKIAIKLLVVEAIELGGKPSYLAKALNISRQTIHNYVETKKHFGFEGLINGYNTKSGENLKSQRKLHEVNQLKGNKAEQVAEIRAQEKEKTEIQSDQKQLNFSFEGSDSTIHIAPNNQPFAETHDWEENRYAGQFIYWMPLISSWKWLHLLMGHFGNQWRIFSVFLLMAGANIRSIEQLKNVDLKEAGRVCGLGRIPSRTVVRNWFYEAAQMNLSRILLKDYFQHQLRAGLVGCWIWFTDGHLLPYTGKEKVHYSYNTQRQMPVPGRTSQVTCDASGRIVDFVIEEGKGGMKEQILSVVNKWLIELPHRPVVVFDREGYDSGYFSKLVKTNQPFVTWQKNVDSNALAQIADEEFDVHFQFNGKDYSILEKEKTFSFSEKDTKKTHDFNLRHFIIWNHSTNHRTAALGWSGDIDAKEAVCAILSRWGASENTFKHIQERHPFHYHPGFKLVESDNQEIANPEIKATNKHIIKLKKELDKLYKRLSKTKEQINKDGTPRQNNLRSRLQSQIEKTETEVKDLRDDKKDVPERVDVSMLENYRSFKRIDNEGKYLFDFVTTSVWNARKDMVDWLRDYYDKENDLVDLFYAITHCHGWIKNTNRQVTVRLEPLQQKKRRAAQEQLCRKLSNLAVQLPNGKYLFAEVGTNPMH